MSEDHPRTATTNDQDRMYRLLKLLNARLSEIEANTSISDKLQSLLQGLVDFVKADTSVISFYSQDHGRLDPGIEASGGLDNSSPILALSVDKLTGLVWQDRHARLIHDYPKWVGETLDSPLAKNPQCALAVPLLIGDQLEGVLSLASNRSPSFLDEVDLELACLFARLAEVAIQSDRRLQKIERLTTTDSLTGVWNRSQFLERAEQAFRQAMRYERPLSAVLIDIDRFKMLNEMHGYTLGDQVLGTVARNIVSRLRDSDLLGRYGGEEFILLLPETDLEHARLAAERMRIQISAAPTETPKGTFFVTISAGVASLESAAIDQLERLLDLADNAMRAAKLAGRNRVAVYSKEGEH